MTRYLTLVGVLVGLGSAAAADVIKVAIKLDTRGSLLGAMEWLFVGAYVVSIGLALAAAAQLLGALTPRDRPVLPSDARLVNHFADHSYIDALYMTTQSLLQATVLMRAEAGNDLQHIGRSHTTLRICRGFALAFLARRVPIQVEVALKEKTGSPVVPVSQPSPAPEPAAPRAPAPSSTPLRHSTDAAPLPLDYVQRTHVPAQEKPDGIIKK
jgi:hypothetical protein